MTLDKNVIVDVKDENEAVVDSFNLKNIINMIIEFIAKILKFEFDFAL